MCSSIRAAYVCELYPRNHLVTLHLWVPHLKWKRCNFYLEEYYVTLHLLMCHLHCSLCLSGVSTVSLCYTTLIGVRPKVHPMFVSSTDRITGLQYNYGRATISAAYVCKLFLHHHWVTPYLWPTRP